MICASCNTANDAENVFCINCGNAVAGTLSGSPTVPIVEHPRIEQSVPAHASNSTETAVVNYVSQQKAASHPIFNTPTSLQGPPRINRSAYWIIGGLCFLLILVVVVFVALPKFSDAEVLPTHLGMFVQSDAKDRVDEVKRQDFSNISEARNSLIKSDSLSVLISRPNLILYSDSKDIPINDVRLIQLDSIKDDGNMKTIEFQVMPIDSKPEMKRIRVRDGLANGKYAFTYFDGYFNEGKHKFWAFQVRDSNKSNNDDLTQSWSVSLKPTPPPQPSTPRITSSSGPVGPPPPSGSTATVRSGRVVVRDGPCLTCRDIGRVFGGQTVYVVNYSENYDTWGGRTGNWAYVRTTGGLQGWVFSPLLR